MFKWVNMRFASLLVFLLLGVALQPSMANDEVAVDVDIYSGYYSRDRTDGKASEIAGSSQYIKFYPNQWVVMIYIPYEYSQTLGAEQILAALNDIKSKAKVQTYFKAKFGSLTEISVAHVEIYRVMGKNQLEFECDGTAPCRVKFSGDIMEVRKAGMLSDHIVDYNRITE